jgi:PAT family beta-lactamase induction signal transducer AmpG
MASAAAPRKISPSVWVASLFAAQSMPYNAVLLVSLLMYKSLGLSDGQIAFWTAWLALPWSLKPFFAPLVEMFSTKRRFVISTQLLAGAGFGVMAFLLPLPFAQQSSLAMMFIVAFNAATHDIASDGYYIESLNHEEQAKYVGLQSTFWICGQVIAQGGLAVLAGWLEIRFGVVSGWMMVWGMFAAMMVGFALFHSFILPAQHRISAKAESIREVAVGFKDVATEFFLKKDIWWLMAFAVIYRVAEGQAEKMATLFMRASIAEGGLGLDTETYGYIYGTVGTIGMVCGALVGGWYVARIGIRRAIFPLALIFNLPNGLFIYLAATQPSSLWIIGLCSTVEKFALGMGTTSLLMVLMQRVAPGRFQTAHYGFAMAVMNLGLIVPSMTAGYVGDFLGYRNYFVYLLLLSIPSIIIAVKLPLAGEPGTIELAPGEDGEWTRRSAWGTAQSAAGFFLLTLFGSLIVAESVNSAMVAGYAILSFIGCALAAAGWRHGLAVQRGIARTGRAIRNQSRLSIALAAFTIVGWASTFAYLYQRYEVINETRNVCLESGELEACKATCANDSSIESCAKVHSAAVAEFVAQPESKEKASASFETFRVLETIRCFDESLAPSCRRVAQAYWRPNESTWRVAGMEPNLEEARRYAAKACQLGDEEACSLSDQLGEVLKSKD